MFEIKAWCFLCASESDVSVEINFLDDCLRELIGTFSIINFSLVSSRICVDCHGFLKEHERRRELYSKVESMYMEILKVRHKPAIDVRAIRAKYEIDNERPAPLKTQADHQSLVNIVQFEINEVEVEELIQTEDTSESPPSRLSQRKPKLLNPTLFEFPKVQDWFECDLCNYSSPSKGPLTRHLISAHRRSAGASTKNNSKRWTVNRLKRDFKCSVCSKTFATVSFFDKNSKTLVLTINFLERLVRAT